MIDICIPKEGEGTGHVVDVKTWKTFIIIQKHLKHETHNHNDKVYYWNKTRRRVAVGHYDGMCVCVMKSKVMHAMALVGTRGQLLIRNQLREEVHYVHFQI